MKHIKQLSKSPRRAETLATDVKLTFIQDFIGLVIPLSTNKDNQNPTA